MIAGSYTDGKSSKAHRVALFFRKEGVVISGSDVLHTWTYYEISKLEKGTNLGLFKGDKIPFESLHIDAAHRDEVFQLLEQYAAEAPFLNEGHLRFERKGLKAYGIAVIGILIALLGIHFLVIPAIVKVITATFPENLEIRLGERYFDLMTEYEIIDKTKSERVQQIADQLEFNTDYELDFYVVESEMINAFALPGGKIVIFTGLLDQMSRVEQLVALMGHETGHVALRHSLQNVFRDQSYGIILGGILGGQDGIVGAVTGITETLNSLHGSRKLEQEADFYALDVLYKNQLDPGGAVELFQLLSDSNSVRIPDVLSTHTSSDTRAQEMRDRIPSLGPEIHRPNPELKELFERLKRTETAEPELEIRIDESLGW